MLTLCSLLKISHLTNLQLTLQSRVTELEGELKTKEEVESDFQACKKLLDYERQRVKVIQEAAARDKNQLTKFLEDSKKKLHHLEREVSVRYCKNSLKWTRY